MTTRRSYGGGAKAAALTAPISAISSTLVCDALLGWPSGGLGNFSAVIGRGLSNEEKILCSASSGGNLTVIQRGYDGTVAQAHGAGEAVEHIMTATDADEANAHTSAVSGHGIPSTDRIVGQDANQVLTNKTMDGDLNTFTDLKLTSMPETVARFVADELLITAAQADADAAQAAAASALATSNAADALRYTKVEADARFEPFDSAYTKAESDARYEPIDTMYTKSESDARYAPIAGSVDSGWVAVTLTSPWTGTAFYRKIGNVLRMRGNVSRPSGSNAIILTLPVGARPPQTYSGVMRNNSTALAMAVATTGDFTISAGYANGDTAYFDQIEFLTD